MDRTKYCRSKSYHILILFSRLSQSEGLVFFQNGHAAHRAELCSANSHKEVTVGSQKLFLSCLTVVSKLSQSCEVTVCVCRKSTMSELCKLGPSVEKYFKKEVMGGYCNICLTSVLSIGCHMDERMLPQS